MIVFSSISPEEIRINDTSSEGVKSFKRFLQYAGGSEIWDQDIVSTGSSSDISGTPFIDRNKEFMGIADDICARFKAADYKTDKGIGKSGYKVDIGVVSKNKEGTYCLGILLDGPVYKAAGTTTSREVSQINVLNGLGWNIVRVWSIEWWENPDKEFRKLIDIIEKENVVQDHEPNNENITISENEDVVTDSFESSKPEIYIYNSSEDTGSEEAEQQAQKKTDDIISGSPEILYRTAIFTPEFMTADKFCDATKTELLQGWVASIVEQESPVSADVLAKELIAAAGLNKMTSKLRDRCSYLVRSIEKTAKLHFTRQVLDPSADEPEEVIFLWKDGTEISKVMDNYRVPAEGEKARKACDIPVQEAACAARYLAVSQYGMPYESLIVETAKSLGLSRAPVDSDNYKLGKKAVDYCINQDILVLDDDGFVKESE